MIHLILVSWICFRRPSWTYFLQDKKLNSSLNPTTWPMKLLWHLCSQVLMRLWKTLSLSLTYLLMVLQRLVLLLHFDFAVNFLTLHENDPLTIPFIFISAKPVDSSAWHHPESHINSSWPKSTEAKSRRLQVIVPGLSASVPPRFWWKNLWNYSQKYPL